ISSIDPERLVASMMVLTVTLAELTTVAILMSKTTNRMTKGTTGMILMATAVRILASSVSALGSMSLDSLTKGIVSLGVVMTELGAFAVLVNKFGGSIGVLNGVSFNLLASSLLILQKAVSSFGAMDLGDIAKGLGAVGVALAEFAGFGFLSSFSKNLISGSVAVTVMSAAMNLLVDPMKELGSLDLETLAKALGAMAIALTERSEEHTSELQSRFDLVCRLLLDRSLRALHSFPTRRSSDLLLSLLGLDSCPAFLRISLAVRWQLRLCPLL